MDKWTEKYIFEAKHTAILKCIDIIQDSKRIVDIGCGDGNLTSQLVSIAKIDSHVIGIDNGSFVEKAKEQGIIFPFQFLSGKIGYGNEVETLCKYTHLFTLFDTYDHMTITERDSFRIDMETFTEPYTRVMILGQFPSTNIQQDGKNIESKDKKINNWLNAGFDIERIVPVFNMELLFGRNMFSYYLTKFFNKVFPSFNKSDYLLIVFRKL